MAICYLVLLLISLTFDRETCANINLFSILSELVSAQAEIQKCQRRQLCCSRGCELCGGATLHNCYRHNLPKFIADAIAEAQVGEKREFLQYSNPAFGGRGTGPAIFKGGRATLHRERGLIWRHSHAGNYTKFNSTLGLPGEGWKRFSVATWNPRSLTKERFEYCKSLGYDVLALTELWRNQGKFQNKTKRFIVSEQILHKDGPKKGEPRFPNDRPAGVGILLSPRMTQKVHSFGSHGERICWVRLRGPFCNLYVVAVYLPHRGRVMPSQEDTLADLQKVLADIPPHDCVCLLGDFNEQLQADIQDVNNWPLDRRSSICERRKNN